MFDLEDCQWCTSVVIGRFLTVLLTPCLFEMNLNPRYTNLQLTNQVLVDVMSSTGELLQKGSFRGCPYMISDGMGGGGVQPNLILYLRGH